MRIKSKIQDPLFGSRRSMDQGIKSLSMHSRKSPCNSARQNANPLAKKKEKSQIVQQTSISIEGWGKIEDKSQLRDNSQIYNNKKLTQSIPTEVYDNSSTDMILSSFNQNSNSVLSSVNKITQKSPRVQSQNYQSFVKDRLGVTSAKKDSQQISNSNLNTSMSKEQR